MSQVVCLLTDGRLSPDKTGGEVGGINSERSIGFRLASLDLAYDSGILDKTHMIRGPLVGARDSGRGLFQIPRTGSRGPFGVCLSAVLALGQSPPHILGASPGVPLASAHG